MLVASGPMLVSDASALFRAWELRRHTGSMATYAIIEAPSVLGLFERGVQLLPETLLDSGLAGSLGARHAGGVPSPAYDPQRDEETGLLNPRSLRDYSLALADATGVVLAAGDVPVVLGGDCSILLGTMLALRRSGRYGLLFLDGHADFYQPEAEPNGEAASMDLALVTGRGPEILTRLDGYRPLVQDEDVVQFGRRDAAQAEQAGSQRIEDTEITVLDLAAIRRDGVNSAVQQALVRLVRPDLEGFWIHLDCDVLDDDIMPAVDYRLPGGLSWVELETVLRAAMATGRVLGVEVTIFNPSLDEDGELAGRLVHCLTQGLSAAGLNGDGPADWDRRYSAEARLFSGHVNASLVAETHDVSPASALDVGCGEGADAIWLAQAGWSVTAVDISQVAIDRARQVSQRLGVKIDWRQADIVADPPAVGRYDLVSVHYPALLHSPGDDAITMLVNAVAPGGTLLVVGHDLAAHAPGGSEHHHPSFDPADYVQPGDVARGLDHNWTIEVHESRPRVSPPQYHGPDVPDVILRARRHR